MSVSAEFYSYAEDDMALMPSVKWLIEGIVPEQSFVLLYGPSGTFKSFIALDIAMHVSQGRDFHGLRTAQGFVAYLAAEGFSTFGPRIRAWDEAHDRQYSGRLRIYDAVPNLRDEGHVTAFIDAVKRDFIGKLPALIIVDTLAMTFGGGNENDSDHMGQYIAGIQRLRRETGAAVLVIHHTGHHGKHPRGHSSLKAAVDTALRTQRTGKGRVSLYTEKMRWAEAAKPLKLRAEPVGESLAFFRDGGQPEPESVAVQPDDAAVKANGGVKTKAADTMADEDRQVLRLILKAGGEMTAAQVSKALGWADSTGRLRVRRLIDAGLLLSRGKTRGRVLSLTLQGMQMAKVK